jgi:hypothetical protein
MIGQSNFEYSGSPEVDRRKNPQWFNPKALYPPYIPAKAMLLSSIVKQFTNTGKGITMGMSSERHKRMAERAEANHHNDFAAHEFFEAAKEYRKQGSLREAQDMRTQELRVLSKIVMLGDSAAELESQASTLTTHASQVSQDSANAPGGASPELYALAAALHEEAADHYLALGEQTENIARKRDCLTKAATQLQRAGRNLARAQSANASPQGEDDARELYWKASRLQSQAAELGEEPPMDAKDVMDTQLTLAWLRKDGRMKCRECERLWKSYTESSARHAALSRMQESGTSDNEELSKHVATAAEWWRISMKAVLDHETNHRQGPSGKFSDPGVLTNTLTNTLSAVRAS